MSKRRGIRPAPFSLRFTEAERDLLLAKASGIPLGAFIKTQLFAGSAITPRVRTRAPVRDHSALAQVLACLGASRIPNNLNQLAHAANSGSLIVDQDTKSAILTAARDIQVMRALLMRALGMKVDDPIAGESPSQSFTRAASAGEGR